MPSADGPTRRHSTPPVPEDTGFAIESEISDRPSRRLGCVIPLAVLGVAFSIGGASIVYDWWSGGGIISSFLLLLCICGGPGFVLLARKIYRDPSF